MEGEGWKGGEKRTEMEMDAIHVSIHVPSRHHVPFKFL